MLVTVAGVAAQFWYLPNDDATWLFAVARRILGGAVLYSPDIVEINPPLIIQMSILVVRISALTAVSAVTVWRLFVAAQIVLSLLITSRLLTLVLGSRAADLRSPFLAFLAWVVACLPSYDYGQREHFIVLWLTPYLILAAGRAAGVTPSRALAVVVGLMLALTLCLKPHYILAVALVELGVLAHTHSLRQVFRHEVATAAVFTVFYLLMVAIWYPGFYTYAIPLAAHYYPAYGTIVFRPIHGAAWVGAIASVLLISTPRIAVTLCRLFTLAGAGAFVAFVLQNKGWPYHFLPSKAFFCIAIAIALVAVGRRALGELPSPEHSKLRPVLTVAAATVVMLGALVWAVQHAQEYGRSRHARVIRNVSAHVDRAFPERINRRMAALSLTLFPAFPTTEMVGADWTLRYSCLWLLPGIMDDEGSRDAARIARGAEGRRTLLAALVEDLERSSPGVVLVEHTPQSFWMDDLLKDDVFRRVWDRYELVSEVEYFQIFRLR